MTDHEKNNNIGKSAFADNNQEKNCCLFEKDLFKISDCLFIPYFCQIVDILEVLLNNSSFPTFWQIECLGD